MLSSVIDHDGDLTVHTARGRVSVPLLSAYLKRFERGTPTQLVLLDFTQADLAEFYEQDIASIFRERRLLAELRRGGKTAMVFSRRVDFGVGRMFESLSELTEYPFQFRSFWDFDAAEAWLFSEGGDWFDKNLLTLGNLFDGPQKSDKAR